MAELIAADVAIFLLEKLGTTAYKQICLARGLKGNIEKLREDIRKIEGFLIDAIENQVKKDDVIDWLTRLKNVFLDAEDVLDEFECEKQRRKFVEEHGSPSRKKEYIGRDDEQRKIVDCLIDHVHVHDHKLSVIHIYGMPGIGKTALAKLVSQDERVNRYFQLKIWVSVTKELEVHKLLEMMLDYITKKKNKNSAKDHLIAELQGYIKQKRFLLILDNVWDEDEEKWEELSGYLRGGCKGSKIVITTRNEQLRIRCMKPDFSHKVEGLSPEYSLSLFLQHACVEGVRDINLRQRLIEIGKEIVLNQCEGVPLVLENLGNLLYSDSNEQSWNRIKESKIWELQGLMTKVSATLLLSYHDLSFDLKRCFLCCSLFERRKEICSLELIQLWMAHGVLPIDESKCLEDIGHEVFNKLRLKSFFKNVINHGWYYTFHMDDIIHQFALSVAKNEYLMLKTSVDESEVPNTLRHLAIRPDGIPTDRELDNDDDDDNSCHGVEVPFTKMKSVRTIIFPGLSSKPSINFFFNKQLIKNYVNLRMLDLSKSSFETLPSYIGGMKRLRSLNLSWNCKLTKLPDSICKLQSLQSLQLQGCTELEGLPKNIKNLRENLIFLSITTKEELFDHDNGIQYLTSLRTLMIDECHKLQLLSDKVIESLTALKTLVISNCKKLLFYEKPKISPTIRLQRLKLSNLPKAKIFPSWIEGCKQSLQYLWLSGCSNLSITELQLQWLSKRKSFMEIQITDCPQLLSLLPDEMHGDDIVVRIFGTSTEDQKAMNCQFRQQIEQQQIMVSEKSLEETSTDSGLSEKIWTEDESFKLIQTMLDLYKSRKLKAEEINANPAEHLEAIKRSLVGKLPQLSNIPTEHIESEIKFLKKRFEIVHEILNGQCSNEFTWNSCKKMVTAEEIVWDVYIQIHPEANEFRNKPFPFYEELKELYSLTVEDQKIIKKSIEIENKDQASTSSSSSSSPEAPKTMSDDETEEGKREDLIPPPMDLVPSITSSDISLAKKNENVSGFGEIGEAIKEAARIIAGEMKDLYGGIDAKIVKLNNELTKNTTLTMTERHKATNLISQNNGFLSILFSLPDQEKEEWVRTLLKDFT
ncbi:putative disease resistance protein RGA3 [Cannabis sativa]|uniref:putative disease resistance protein RGA3 n=1 Tax=Cannabis sativa TaxID=3483 RepID=UPI0029C9F34A|nr:putative disease resistance protein RGA3 [Cannabis sativa]